MCVDACRLVDVRVRCPNSQRVAGHDFFVRCRVLNEISMSNKRAIVLPMIEIG